jgi:hypothetical protein
MQLTRKMAGRNRAGERWREGKWRERRNRGKKKGRNEETREIKAGEKKGVSSTARTMGPNHPGPGRHALSSAWLREKPLIVQA